jgi:pilus assembly protein CpaB
MLVLALVALILSGGVTYLAYRVLKGALQPKEATSKVIVAAKKLDLGYRITKEDIKLVDWPQSMVLPGSFNDAAMVVDRGTMASIEINEPILESKLAPKGAGAGLMTMIPEGMRALSIQVNSIIGVAGFVSPGSRVDLILTAIPPKDVKGAKGEEMGSKIILENLEVLAAGQNVQRDVEGKPQTVQDVTLLLTPDQAQRVALATGDGRIQLALRNPMDKEAAEPLLVVRSKLYEGPTMEQLKDRAKDQSITEKPDVKKASGSGSGSKPSTAVRAAKKAPAVTAPPPPPPPPAVVQQRMVTIEVIKGSNRSQSNFEDTNPDSTENSTKLDGAN